MTTSAAAPTKADIKAADELDAMANLIDVKVPENTLGISFVEFGRRLASAAAAAAAQLRERAAELRRGV